MNTPPITVQPPELHGPYRYVAIEGPIGVGKTSLAQRLADRWSMHTLLERCDDNPFLARFYDDMPRYALATQLHFTLQRVTQAREAAQALATGTTLVSDFIAQKSAVFARLTLADDEWQLYQAVAPGVEAATLPIPDLVVYLQASPATLLARVGKRARPAERQISDSYLRALSDAYDQFFFHYDESPVLTVNTEHLDLLGSDADFALLIEQIETMRGRRASFVKAQ